MRLNYYKPGSSLILVLLVIAGILTVVFGAQRVTLVQFSQSNREEDNVSAYYAARAGIEDGLIRYRFSRNAETTKDKVYRFNITAGEVVGQDIDPSTPIGDPASQYYDLSMGFKTKQINMVSDSDPTPDFSKSLMLAKDNILELTGLAYGSTSFLRSAFQFHDPITGGVCTNAAAFVQIERRSEAEPPTLAQFRAEKPAAVDTYDSSENGQPNIQIDTANSIRVRPYYCDVRYAFATALTTAGKSGGPEFDSLTANITATGYFGAAKRKLLATVNRSTGRLIDIYDFNAFSGTGNVKP